MMRMVAMRTLTVVTKLRPRKSSHRQMSRQPKCPRGWTLLPTISSDQGQKVARDHRKTLGRMNALDDMAIQSQLSVSASSPWKDEAGSGKATYRCSAMRRLVSS